MTREVSGHGTGKLATVADCYSPPMWFASEPWIIMAACPAIVSARRLIVTVVLSLGAGWMMRGIGPAPIASSPSVTTVAEEAVLYLRGADTTPPVLDATLIIPGLTVLEVIFLSEASGGGIRVIQELPDGSPVEIYYRAVAESPTALSDARELYELALPNGWGLEVLLGPRPGELTVLRGPLTETELTDLVGRMGLPNP